MLPKWIGIFNAQPAERAEKFITRHVVLSRAHTGIPAVFP
jgi:hypothetical protein